MALPSTHRWLAVGKLSIRNHVRAPNYAPEFSVQDLISALRDRMFRDASHRQYSQDKRLMWCSDLNEDEQYYRLLVQAGDKNVTGVSFLNFEDRTTRDVEKEEDEGGHYASHIIIKKNPDPSGRHLILIEKVPGIYLSSIKNHFTWACNLDRYSKTASDGHGQNKSFRPYFEVLGHQSKTIREALRTGTLQDVELIGHNHNYPDGLDEDPIVQDVVHEARFEVKRRVSEDQAKTLFNRVRSAIPDFRGGTDTTQMFVRIKTQNGQIKRAEVDHHDNEILEQAFIQSEIVTDFDPPLTQRYETFRDDMIQKMVEIANSIGD